MTDILQEYFETGLKFHGHKCPAMPMGLRIGLAALKALSVERAKIKELMVISETMHPLLRLGFVRKVCV